MAFCSSIITAWNSPTVFQIQSTATNPADISTCDYIFMSGAEYGNALQLASLTASVSAPVVEPFDNVLAGQFFAFGFTGLLTLYFISHVIGLLLKFIRDN